jgi:hypothetical protein
MGKPNVAESLSPLTKLRHLSGLDLFNLKVREDGLLPLANCRRLRNLGLSNQFPTEQYALLSVRLPKTECAMFKAWVKPTLTKEDVMIVGRGKPFLSSKKDRARILRYESSFANLRASFAANKSLGRTRER